jgi:hypothetical protein
VMQGNSEIASWFAWKPKENIWCYPHDSLVIALLMAAWREICTDSVRIQKIELKMISKGWTKDICWWIVPRTHENYFHYINIISAYYC